MSNREKELLRRIAELEAQNKMLLQQRETTDTAQDKGQEDSLKAQAKGLRLQLTNLNYFYNISPVGMCFVSPELRYIHINEALAQINGKPVAEHIGKTFRDIIPHIADKIEAVYRQVLESRKPVLNIEIKGASPTNPNVEKVWSVNHYPVQTEDGTLLGVGAVVQDITTQVHSSEQSRKNEEMLMMTGAMAKIGGWEIDLETMSPIWSEQVYRIHEIDPHVDPKLQEALDFYPPEARPIITEAFQKCADQGIGYDLELPFITAKGNHLWVRAIGKAEKKDGKVVRIHGTFQDVTIRKKAEEALVKKEEQLRQSQKMEALGTLAGGIAHDFNNILASMLGNTEMLMMEFSETSEEMHNLNNILKGIDRATNLVKQILTFSRMDSAKLRVIKLASVLEDAIQIVRASIPKNIEIQQILHKGAYTLADPTQIQQIILNLCTNSYHAIEEQEGTIKVILKELKQWPSHFHQKGRCVVLSISDTGCGIAPENLDRIFDPFYTTKEVGKGTGLGLSVVHGIVERHQGKIEVKSKVGMGTTFSIFFPIIEKQASEDPNKSELPLSESVIKEQRKHILIVEDELDIAQSYQKFLTKMGYRVTLCSNGEDAINVFRNNSGQFDLILSDQAMPHMTGKQLAQAILKIRPQLPFILSTGYSDVITEEEANAIGIRQYLLKPISFQKLKQSIQSCLS